MKPNLKQANARIKAIMQSDGLSWKEAQKQYWAAYKNNIGYKVAKLRKGKESEAQKAARAQERQSKAAFRQKCHSISGTTNDGLKIKIQLTQPVKRRTKKPSKTGGTQPGSANY